jgi:hypothetical protein
MNALADQADDVLRISMDAKAVVKVGPFARGGKSRVHVEATDHDFQPVATVTPVGISSRRWMNCLCTASPPK